MGAYGGRKDIMEMVAPAGPMYQAGTLSGNPLAMTAGIKVGVIMHIHIVRRTVGCTAPRGACLHQAKPCHGGCWCRCCY